MLLAHEQLLDEAVADMPELFVHQPGFLTTVQDLGRHGFAHLGISASGAADPISLRIGNLLVGNNPNTPALEMTLVGGVFESDADLVCAITGSDFSPTLNGHPVPLWQTVVVPKGKRLAFGATMAGARCYLCIGGGIAVPRILGSASTHLQSKLGGFEGRALRAGDRLKLDLSAARKNELRRFSDDAVRQLLSRTLLRITRGVQYDFFTPESQKALSQSRYAVTEDTDRMGIRLQGTPLHRQQPKDILTQGVSLGAIQVPPDGQPIILFVEHQTTGGYPIIANVISADVHRLGQLRPRDEVRFELVSFREAQAFLTEQEQFITSQIRSH